MLQVRYGLAACWGDRDWIGDVPVFHSTCCQRLLLPAWCLALAHQVVMSPWL